MNPQALLADGFEAACVGYTTNSCVPTVAVYDRNKCVQILIDRDGMSHEDAEEYLSFNTEGAYVGESGPLFIELWPDSAWDALDTVPADTTVGHIDRG
jgi:hypothetical protein